MTIFFKTNWLRENQFRNVRKWSFEHKDANGKKKKHVFLEHEVSDWLHIWTAASSLDIKGNKAIKKALTGRFPQICDRLWEKGALRTKIEK